MEMTPQRWTNTCDYLDTVFAPEDDQLRTLMERAVAAGLPDIAVSPATGRFLRSLASLVSARVIVEVGTLAGYSGIWLCRGLADGGRLITIDINDKHLAFARAEFQRAGLADRVQLRQGAALDVIPQLAKELGPNSIDLAFLDGVKTEYPEYFRLLKPLIRVGGLLTADNILGSSFWIDDAPGSSPERDAVDRFNRAVAGDSDLDTAAVPVGNGILLARRSR